MFCIGDDFTLDGNRSIFNELLAMFTRTETLRLQHLFQKHKPYLLTIIKAAFYTEIQPNFIVQRLFKSKSQYKTRYNRSYLSHLPESNVQFRFKSDRSAGFIGLRHL